MLRQTMSAIGLLAVLAAGEARADDQWFADFCLVGAIRTCASIELHTTAILDASGNRIGTAVVLRIRNLEGIHPTDNTGGSVITRVGITQPNIGTTSDLVVGSAGSVGVVGTPENNWVINNNPIGGQVEFSAGLDNSGSNQGQLNGGVLGCNNPDGFASLSEYFRTCSNDGWVVFSFNTTGIWSADEAQVAWMIQSAAVDGGSYECRTEDATGEHACLPSVVAEPMTVTLLGTGLLGAWVTGWRRRRKGSTVVDA